jgi:alkanesulfonate monooxygenase SsuD/methylene tetrahydromethanopterin reductase-like flavin-dependent oxidoreductase (luciferase family)
MEPTDPILDPLVHLAYVAAVTERLELGTGIVILPQRNLLFRAKQAASLDVLSGAGCCSESVPAISSRR